MGNWFIVLYFFRDLKCVKRWQVTISTRWNTSRTIIKPVEEETSDLQWMPQWRSNWRVIRSRTSRSSSMDLEKTSLEKPPKPSQYYVTSMCHSKNIGSSIVLLMAKGICNVAINIPCRDWTDEIFESACKELTREMKPEDDLERKEFRLTLILSYFFKFKK